MKSTKSFTLVELLIVVAIIAILAAIAVPNFLEAQARSKVARVKNDLRTAALACEAFCVDNHRYPSTTKTTEYDDRWCLWLKHMNELTTPVAYLTSVSMRDPFHPKLNADQSDWVWPGDTPDYLYVDYGDKNALSWYKHLISFIYPENFFPPPRSAFMIASWGPDRVYSAVELCVYDVAPRDYTGKIENGNEDDRIYDPTNGTLSKGDIARWGGDMFYPQTP